MFLVIFVIAFAILAAAQPNGVLKALHFTRSKDIAASYDYVIIGGGTSGLTVADRLTEDGNCLSNAFSSGLEYTY
jgi:choline dehydrogenase